MKKYGYLSMFAVLLLVGFEASAVSDTQGKWLIIKPGSSLSAAQQQDVLQNLCIGYADATSAKSSYPTMNQQPVIFNKKIKLHSKMANSNFGFSYKTARVNNCIGGAHSMTTRVISQAWPSKNIISGTYVLDYNCGDNGYYLTPA